MKKSEYINKLENALYIRKVHCFCPSCNNDLDQGMPHSISCAHYETELLVLKTHGNRYNTQKEVSNEI